MNIYESRDDPVTSDVISIKMADEDVILNKTILCFDSTVFINIHEVSTLLPIRSTLLPIRSTLSPVCTLPKQQSTLSTFNKVDRVEFNFVASVHRALYYHVGRHALLPFRTVTTLTSIMIIY